MTGRDIGALVRAMRPRQWTKNGVVLAAFFFALGDSAQSGCRACFPTVLQAALLFCLLSAATYLFNDVRDLSFDRAHPAKRRRPIAAGEVAVPTALAASALLAAGGMLWAAAISPLLFAIAAAYLGLQLLYTLLLKTVALVDVFMIAAGFVLRTLAGAVALRATISPWLILCAMLLALFLALCKRRHEKIAAGADTGESRPALAQYDERLLDLLIAIVCSATIVCYAIYTLWPQTVEKFGTSRLALTIPFVVFGLFRYLDLVYRHDKGDKPEQILLTDLPLLGDILLYGLTVVAVLLWFR